MSFDPLQMFLVKSKIKNLVYNATTGNNVCGVLECKFIYRGQEIITSNFIRELSTYNINTAKDICEVEAIQIFTQMEEAAFIVML